MDGSAYILLLLVCAASGMPMIEENSEEPVPDTTVTSEDMASQTVPEVVISPTTPITDTTKEEIIETTTTTEISELAELPKNCTTSRNLAGSCVQRASCEHSTNAIDFTLFAPHGYVKTCKEEEVCCPLEYVVAPAETLNNQSTQRVNNNNDEAFEFDDDD